MFIRSFTNWILQAIVFTIFTMLVFGCLNLFKVEVGTATVWVAGVIFYWVLSGITILPWNVYFAADDTLEEIRLSRAKGLSIDEHGEEYARKISKKSWIMAVLIHIFVGVVFLFIALFTPLGIIAYFAAAAAFALTFMRPGIRAAEHVVSRLQNISKETKYPRDDVLELKERVAKIEFYDETAKNMQKSFDENTKQWQKKLDETTIQIEKEFDEKCRKVQVSHEVINDRIDKFEVAVNAMKKYVDQKIASISSATEIVSALETMEKRGISSITFANKKEKQE